MADEIMNDEETTFAAAEEQAKEPETETEMAFCAVSKQMVPLEETVEIERKKGEVLRVHAKYKKY